MLFTDAEYQARISDLFEKHPTVQRDGFTGGAYKPGLDGMRGFDARIGSPWKRFRTVHVAGTNGKGSVSSMLAAAISSKGMKTGLYTSPHLFDFRERMKVVEGGSCRMIPREDVWEFLETFPTDGLSFFEITTGMALWWFAREGVDLAVVEVGLGGRLDSTNVIVPQLSVITSIGLDHCAMLGNTRAEIASEKGGIIKSGVPVVIGATDSETEPVFRGIASSLGSEIVFADSSETGIDEDALLARMDLQGPCQRMNLRTVLTSLRVLGIEPGEGILRAIAGTARITEFGGRWQKICDSPEIICDIGHNPPALAVNFARLKEIGRPLLMVYGIMADKDLAGIAPLIPEGTRMYLCAPGTTRALPASDLAERLSALRPDLVTRPFPSVGDALRSALEDSTDDSLIYVGGSTFVVSELQYWNKISILAR